MNIISGFNIKLQQLSLPQNKSHSTPVCNKGLTCDVFERSVTTINSPSFQANVTNGQFLRTLSGIHDPYSGVIILNNKEINQAYRDLAKLQSSKEKIDYLSYYTKNMLPVEYSAFNLLKKNLKRNSRLSLQEILTTEAPTAKKNLIAEHQEVFDKIYELTPQLSTENEQKVLSLIMKAGEQIQLPKYHKNYFKKTRFIDKLVVISQNKTIENLKSKINEIPDENAREYAMNRLCEAFDILENNPHDINYHGMTPLERVKKLQEEFIPETLSQKNELQEIIETASTLPTPKDSINSFIIDMYDKPDNIIAKRLISESLGTIEHIVPDSKGGENEAHNFLFVTKSRNEERGNMPLTQFMKKYPKIPQYCQEYMDDIVKAGLSTKLRNHEWYPYVIKETLQKEIGAKIKINNYKISPQKAFKSFPERLKEKFPKFSKYTDARG